MLRDLGVSRSLPVCDKGCDIADTPLVLARHWRWENMWHRFPRILNEGHELIHIHFEFYRLELNLVPGVAIGAVTSGAAALKGQSTVGSLGPNDCEQGLENEQGRKPHSGRNLSCLTLSMMSI